MKEEIDRWYRKLWITKGCRFITAKRYEKHNQFSNITITVVSVYIITLNLTVLLENRPPLLSDSNITFSTICASILVLVLSLIINSREYQILANKFHDCGREITEVYDDLCILKATKTDDEGKLKEIITRYHAIIKKHDINHSNMDNNLFTARNISEFNLKKDDLTPWESTCLNISNFTYIYKTKIAYFFYVYFYYLLALIIPVIACFYL